MIDDISLSLLQKTHFSVHESRVYLATLQLGKGTVSEIAETAELKRTSVYPIIDELVGHGYLTPVQGGKIQTYAAADPNILATELDTASRDFKEMIPYLRGLQRKAGKPHVTYYNGAQGARRAWAQIKRPKNVRYAVSIRDVATRVPDEVERWKKLYVSGKARPGGRHLLTDTIEDRTYGKTIEQANQVVKYLSKDQNLDMDLALFDDKVVLTGFDDDIHVTVIESESLSRSLCALYDLAWKAAKNK